jgi:hypothetical protein
MKHDKSIAFLLDNAGPVIRYRLRKEILNNLTKTEEENLLEQIYQTPYFKLAQSYVKPNGYIGSGFHSWDNWRGAVLHATPLQDGETAARLLSNYAIPKTHPIVANFVAAMRNEDTLRDEFSYIPPEINRFNTRYLGMNNGFGLAAWMYTIQAMLGFGDDYDDIRKYQSAALTGFKRSANIASIMEIAKRPAATGKTNYPYIEEADYFPCSYTLAVLAHTQGWRTADNITMLADSINNISENMRHDENLYVKINGRYYAQGWSVFNRLRAFRTDLLDSIMYRRPLTEIAMLGVGNRVGIICESAANIEEALCADGILRLRFDLPHNKNFSPKKIEYPTAYSDVRLESDYKSETALLCDLTFWAVQFLYTINKINYG